MRSQPQDITDLATELAQRLPEALIGERIIPRFVDSYVVEHGRHALQVHASLYRDRLALLQREALLALTVQAISNACFEPVDAKKSKPRPMSRKDAATFRRKFLAALARQQKWTAGDALDFQTDLQIYEELIRRSVLEALRDDPSGTVFLATMGTVAAHTARATFASNLFAAGGIGCVNPGRNDDVEAVLAAYRGPDGGQPVVCLTGADGAYAAWGAEVVAGLRAAGAQWVMLAGKPIDGIDVDYTCAMGVDALDFLNRTREKF